MTAYVVVRKTDGQKVFEYSADAPIAWSGIPFTDFSHIDIECTANA